MKSLKDFGTEYLDKLEKKGKKCRIHRSYQLIGLEITEILNDLKHKALYIKLAKIHDNEKLLRLAKMVAENPKIKNRGGYFMRLLQKSK